MLIVHVIDGLVNVVMIISIAGIGCGLVGAVWRLTRGHRMADPETRQPHYMVRRRPTDQDPTDGDKP